MKLTTENKAAIDAMSIEELLRKWRNTPVGDPWFADETGSYFGKRMAELRDADPERFTAASKTIGWAGVKPPYY